MEYQQASKKMVAMSPLIKDDDFYDTMDGNWSNSSEELRKWVDDNQEALAIWKEGTLKPDFVYHQPRRPKALNINKCSARFA